MRYFLPLVALMGCTAPDTRQAFTVVDLVVDAEPDAASARLIDLMNTAKKTLHVALPKGENTDVSDAILAAVERGVEVEVVTDFDHAADPAIEALDAANVPLRLADAGLKYFDFNLGADIEWPSTAVKMSHGYAIADRRGFVIATGVGSRDSGQRITFEGRSNDLAWDLWQEHNQVFGGADATSLTQYSNPQKSITDMNWAYATQDDVVVETWMGPQERLGKRVIDSVYAARSSIRILTDDFSNEGLAEALQTKASYGFSVEVIVGPHFKDDSATLSGVLEKDTPDVTKSKVTGVERVPTVILIDTEDSATVQPMAMVMSHDLFSSVRVEKGKPVTNDQLIDGNMVVITDNDGQLGPAFSTLEELWNWHKDQAGAL